MLSLTVWRQWWYVSGTATLLSNLTIRGILLFVLYLCVQYILGTINRKYALTLANKQRIYSRLGTGFNWQVCVLQYDCSLWKQHRCFSHCCRFDTGSLDLCLIYRYICKFNQILFNGFCPVNIWKPGHSLCCLSKSIQMAYTHIIDRVRAKSIEPARRCQTGRIFFLKFKKRNIV
jgi:hypothetical protein